MKHVAFATYERLPDLDPDDRLVLEPLRQRGVEVHKVRWDDPTADWAGFDAVVVRNPWDYFEHLDRFLLWIDRVEQTGVPFFNAPSILRGNVVKTYLRDLAACGLPVVPTAWLEQGEAVRLVDVLGAQGWREAVVKPVVSAGAFETWTVTPAEAEARQSDLDRLLARSGVMVQGLLEEIRTEGELSFVFFDGRFSHAARKRPKAGDFRVQERMGGRTEPFGPPEALIAQAARFLEPVPGTLYARVDGVVQGDTLTLMEMELTEPSLYLGQHPEAAERFADAVACRVR